MQKRGKLIVLSGPSGCGKNTVYEELVKKDPNIVQTVSATTRAPREGERDGVEYYFMTEEAFREKEARGEFLETVLYGKNHYGTLKSEVDRLLAEERIVILIIEVNGAGNIKRSRPDAVSVFLMPPSLEALRRRLVKRGQDSAEDIERRLSIAAAEMEARVMYDYCVVNDDLAVCVQDVYNIIQNN